MYLFGCFCLAVFVVVVSTQSSNPATSVAASGLTGGTCVVNEDCTQAICDTCQNTICSIATNDSYWFSLSTTQTKNFSYVDGDTCFGPLTFQTNAGDFYTALAQCETDLKAFANPTIIDDECIDAIDLGGGDWQCEFEGIGQGFCPNGRVCSKQMVCVECTQDSDCAPGYCATDNVCIIPSTNPPTTAFSSTDPITSTSPLSSTAIPSSSQTPTSTEIPTSTQIPSSSTVDVPVKPSKHHYLIYVVIMLPVMCCCCFFLIFIDRSRKRDQEDREILMETRY